MFENLIIINYICSQFQRSSVRFVKIDISATLLSFITMKLAVNMRTRANSRERISLAEFGPGPAISGVSACVEERRASSSELLAHRVFQSALSKDRVTSNPTAKLGQHLLGDLRKRRNTRATPSGEQEASALRRISSDARAIRKFSLPLSAECPIASRSHRLSWIMASKKVRRLRNSAY